jgi:hypothetical protein
MAGVGAAHHEKRSRSSIDPAGPRFRGPAVRFSTANAARTEAAFAPDA